MSSAPLGKKTGTTFRLEEAECVEKDKKKIKATGFKKAYELFLQTLPYIVADEKQFFKTKYKIFRIENLACNCEAYVAKKIHWKNMNGRMRVVFCVKEDLVKVIEVYIKNQQDVENRDRICENCV